jgi:hypothetical protein
MELHFNASLNDFRSLMSRLSLRHGGHEWTLPSGARLVVEKRPVTDPNTLAWVVSIPLDLDGSNTRHATVHAISRGERSTVVLFHDSRTISQNPLSLGEIQDLSPDRAIGSPLVHELFQELQRQMNAWAPPLTALQVRGDSAPVMNLDSGHFAYPPDERREIVEHFRADHRKGKILNKDSWAQSNYMISGKTLRRYEVEFPEQPRRTQTDT